MLDQLSTRQKVALVVALPASMVLLYLLFRQRDDDDVKQPSKNPVAGERQSIEMSIPYNKVGPLIGREGCNIKKIQSESGASVKFADETRREGTDDRVLRIHGNRDSILLAERLILDFLAEQAEIITKVLMLPQQAVGRIIGRQGTNIRKIQNSSKARVKIDREGGDSVDMMRRCTISGTLKQVDIAESMIQEDVSEMEDYNQRLAEAAANRKERPTGKSPKLPSSVDFSVHTAQEPERQWHVEATTATVTPPPTKEFFTVYMSAVEHPQHFWLQIVNSKARQLDLVRETMTEFYNNPENQKSFAPDSLQVGEIVAAPFSYDQAWYRTRILGFLDDDMLDLYYVDYGDCGSVPKASVCTLRDDFLSLPFQAVEFSLANCFPTGEQWSEEAIIYFEELSAVAKWKPLQARIVDYHSSEAGTIPCVELFDTNGDVDINIGKQLRYRGYAKSSKAMKDQENKETKLSESASLSSGSSAHSTGMGGDGAQNLPSDAPLL